MRMFLPAARMFVVVIAKPTMFNVANFATINFCRKTEEILVSLQYQ